MKKTLKMLTLLQEIDGRVHAMKIRQAEIPNQIEEQVRAVERAVAREKELEDLTREVQKSVKAKNLELKGCEEKIYQKEVQLNEISTNDAYKAMLKEIAGLKADKSLVEDEILELSYKEDEIKIQIGEAQKELAAARNEHDLRKAELDEQAKALERQIEELRASRNRSVVGVDRDVLAQYDRILQHRGGQGLAAVRDKHCQGCQMNLTLQEMSILIACKEVLFCRTCSRILYLEEIVDPVEVGLKSQGETCECQRSHWTSFP